MTNQQKQSGRGSNLTEEDRRKGGEHSHQGKEGNFSRQGSKQGQNQGVDRQKGGQQTKRQSDKE